MYIKEYLITLICDHCKKEKKIVINEEDWDKNFLQAIQDQSGWSNGPATRAWFCSQKCDIDFMDKYNRQHKS